MERTRMLICRAHDCFARPRLAGAVCSPRIELRGPGASNERGSARNGRQPSQGDDIFGLLVDAGDKPRSVHKGSPLHNLRHKAQGRPFRRSSCFRRFPFDRRARQSRARFSMFKGLSPTPCADYWSTARPDPGHEKKDLSCARQIPGRPPNMWVPVVAYGHGQRGQ